uniref:RAB33B, member RAS oncogene family n=1 Tax=Nothobranchius korthausae TaxID=1143690 RepID=A0A1A8FW10_9TELE
MESSLELSSSLGSVSSLLTRCRTFKVLVIGDSGVGKTCLTHRLCAAGDTRTRSASENRPEMFFRRVWQRTGPLAQRIFSPASRNSAPVRRMAFGVPGVSTNMTYFVLCGGGLTAAVVYAYKTVNGDTERYEDRLANMNTQAKVKEAPDAAAPAAAEEEPSPAEVIIESVPAEPAADVSADEADEAATEGAAADVVEAVVTEAPAESAEEAAPAAVEEAAPEAVVEAAAAETPGTAAVDETLPQPSTDAETPSEAAEAEAAPAAEVAA